MGEILKIGSTTLVMSCICHVSGRKYDKWLIVMTGACGIGLVILTWSYGLANGENFKRGTEVLIDSASWSNFGSGLKVIGEWGAGLIGGACDWVVGLFK